MITFSEKMSILSDTLFKLYLSLLSNIIILRESGKMRENNVATFVTGQQLGLLGGPLYTTYKALGAIHYAEKSKGKAVYWLETNDADFNEINQIHYIDSDKNLRSLKWDIDSKGYSCGSILVDKKLVSILNEFFNTIIVTEHTSELKDMALDCYVPGRTLGEASACLAAKLFEDFDLEIFDPSIAEFRKFSRQILLNEAERTSEGEQCNLFYMEGNKRRAVFKKGGKYVDRKGDEADLLSSVLVPSLKTRSICQDAYFLTASYIAGPGEVKYLKELGPNFKFHNVKPAEVIPRMSIDLLEPSIKRVFGKLGINISDLDKINRDEMIRSKLKDLTGFDKKELILRSGTIVENLMSELKDIGLSADKLGKKLKSEIKELIGIKRKSEKEKSESVIRQIEMLYKHLRPFGKKQERVFNVFYYMNLYGGREFIKRIYDRYDNSVKLMETGNE